MNAWSDIAQSYIEGALLQCRRGEWSVDGKPIKTGASGVRLVLLMSSAEVGEILFEDSEKVGERVGLIENGFTPARQIEPGWSPSTKVVCVGFSRDIRGQVMTFRSSSWGGRFAFNALVGTYCRFRQQQFPAVYLDVTKKTRNGNTVIDPLFVVDHWLPREGFETPGALPEPPPPPKLTQEARAASSPAGLRKPPIIVTSGPEQSPPGGDQGRCGVDDEIPF